MGRNAGGVIGPRNGNQAITPATVIAAEKKIRGNKTETAIVFDGKGKLLSQTKGDSNSVTLSSIPKDSIITHNHPSGYSFSKQDLYTSVSNDILEIRAVGPTYTYSIRRPSTGWGVSKAEIKDIYDGARLEAKKKVDRYYYNGPDRRHAANMLLNHLIIKSISEELGWKYTKKRI